MVPFLTHLFENTHIFAQIYSSETKVVIVVCKLCLQTAKRVYKNQRIIYAFLSYDVTSVSEITPCNKICKTLVVYRFSGNVMTSITTLRT